MIKHLTTLGFFMLLMLHVQAQSDPVSYGNNPEAGHYLSTRGIKLYYETYGSGEPILMIHGNGGSISSLDNQITYFSVAFRVIAVDSRAHGKSVDPRDSLSFEMMADDFNALLDSLYIPSCRVLGWSDGGINALMLAIRHPGKVKMIAETGANLWPDSTALQAADLKDVIAEYENMGKKEQTAEVRNARKVMALDIYQPHITREQLGRIKCPVLVIGGDHDIILPEHTLTIARYIPKSFLWIVPDSGHATLIQHKDMFNQIVEAFFAGQLQTR
jgi:pimeloyl-ACP methyl ester carboxylesterase